MSVDRELVTRKMVLIVRDFDRLRAIHRGGVSGRYSAEGSTKGAS
jgi:hypothetical protein